MLKNTVPVHEKVSQILHVEGAIVKIEGEKHIEMRQGRSIHLILSTGT